MFLYFLKRKLFSYFGKRKFQKNSLYFKKRNFFIFRGAYILENGTLYLTKFCYSLTKTPLGKSGCLSSLYYLPAAQGSRFLIHLSFPNTVSRDIFGTLPLTVQYSCDLRKAMPRHWSPSTCHSTFSREAKDFPRGGRYHKEVPLPTFCNMFNQ